MATNTTGDSGRSYQNCTLHFYRRTISYNTTGIGTDNTIDIGVIPPNAVLYDAVVKVNTAFNAGTNNLINVGTADDPDGVVDELDIDATAAEFQSVRRGCDLTFTSATTIYATYVQSGTAASAGEAEIIIAYIPDTDR